MLKNRNWLWKQKMGCNWLKTDTVKICPSMLSFITGPSRTADIENTLVIGAHGPTEVFVFIVDDTIKRLTKCKRNTYFISDFHLGIPNFEESLAREKRIISFLNSIKTKL
jgi:hypothetical protein